MVRLLRCLDNYENSLVTERFNPTMVRLLLSGLVGMTNIIRVSIPQWCDCCGFCQQTRLPFSSVSIPQWCDCCLLELAREAGVIGFNPTMVRLLPSGRGARTSIWLTFQSHNGAIAARNGLAAQGVIIVSFNPTMVRLLPKQHHAN